VARENSRQLAEQAGHPTPDGLQHASIPEGMGGGSNSLQICPDSQ
jgi:hypothetical protein